jgi:dephospho-CoA kinase
MKPAKNSSGKISVPKKAKAPMPCESSADGLYSWTEYKIFEESFGDSAIIIAIVAPNAMRHKRLASRPDRPLTEREAKARDYAEIENLEKGGPIANADYFLANETTVTALQQDLQKLLPTIGIDLK